MSAPLKIEGVASHLICDFTKMEIIVAIQGT